MSTEYKVNGIDLEDMCATFSNLQWVNGSTEYGRCTFPLGTWGFNPSSKGDFLVSGLPSGWTVSGFTYTATSSSAGGCPGGQMTADIAVGTTEILAFTFYTKLEGGVDTNGGPHWGLTNGTSYKVFTWNRTSKVWQEGSTTTNAYFVNNCVSTTQQQFQSFIIGSGLTAAQVLARLPCPIYGNTYSGSICALQLTSGATTCRIRSGSNARSNSSAATTTYRIINPTITVCENTAFFSYNHRPDNTSFKSAWGNTSKTIDVYKSGGSSLVLVDPASAPFPNRAGTAINWGKARYPNGNAIQAAESAFWLRTNGGNVEKSTSPTSGFSSIITNRTAIWFEMVGGGGGGANTYHANAMIGGELSGGGGGGGGGYVQGIINLSTAGTIKVTIGNGGNGGVGNSADGNAGGNTMIEFVNQSNKKITANGGDKGTVSNSSSGGGAGGGTSVDSGINGCYIVQQISGSAGGRGGYTGIAFGAPASGAIVAAGSNLSTNISWSPLQDNTTSVLNAYTRGYGSPPYHPECTNSIATFDIPGGGAGASVLGTIRGNTSNYTGTGYNKSFNGGTLLTSIARYGYGSGGPGGYCISTGGSNGIAGTAGGIIIH